MTNESDSTSHDRKAVRKATCTGLSGGIYGMAFIGAAVYFIQHAATFWAGVLGVVKAIFWPAVLVYKVLELLQM
jgi:hypothetical protein